jgi:hypothetical protein
MPWSDELEALIDAGVLTGFALLTVCADGAFCVLCVFVRLCSSVKSARFENTSLRSSPQRSAASQSRRLGRLRQNPMRCSGCRRRFTPTMRRRQRASTFKVRARVFGGWASLESPLQSDTRHKLNQPNQNMKTGRKLVVIASSPGDYVAVAPRHSLCVAARHLSCGTLLASFAAPVRAQTVAVELDRCAAALQA